jgi:two-component system LytT family response regulator
MLTAIIIEDEPLSRKALEALVTKYVQGIEVIGTAGNVAEGVKLIHALRPEIVFLDIELPEQNGFKLFDYCEQDQFFTIFTTAYSDYAIKALKMSAVDYLLKPIDPDELSLAVEKVKKQKEKLENKKIETLRANINDKANKIALPVQEGYVFEEIKNIVRCEATDNYTLFYFEKKDKMLVSKTLGNFEEILGEHDFLRINRTDMVNLNFVAQFIRGKKSTLVLQDGTILSVSEQKKNELIDYYVR